MATTRQQGERARAPHQVAFDAPSVQELLDRERVPVPAVLRDTSFVPQSASHEVAKERYYSPEFFRLEVERLWGKVWQVACLEQDIPDVGDVHVYEVADYSLLVTRVAPDEIRAYHNACLHRGRQLRHMDGNVQELRCPFHGFCWNLDGSFRENPAEWDFPHVDRDAFALPQAKVGVWEGFVFVNMDPDCEPLETFLGGIVQHFESASRPRLGDRWKAVHVAKPLRSNWKVALEAFMESMHTVATHPQGLMYAGDANAEYDSYPGERHWNRMVTPFAVPSPHIRYEVSQDDIANAMQRDLQVDSTEPEEIVVPEGKTAREVLAERFRETLRSTVGYDASALTDSEMLDAYEYWVFPNLCPWMTIGAPLVYRFRPYGNDPDSSILDIMLLLPLPEGAPRPPAAPVHWLGWEDSWTEAPELGTLGRVFDQDMGNVPYVQRGLRAMTRPTVVFGEYQENHIRQFHRLLDEYLDLPPGAASHA